MRYWLKTALSVWPKATCTLKSETGERVDVTAAEWGRDVCERLCVCISFIKQINIDRSRTE